MTPLLGARPSPALVPRFPDALARLGQAVGQPSAEGILPDERDGAGMMLTLADIQAEEGIDAADTDHTLSPAVPSAGRPKAPSCPIHITKSPLTRK